MFVLRPTQCGGYIEDKENNEMVRGLSNLPHESGGKSDQPFAIAFDGFFFDDFVQLCGGVENIIHTTFFVNFYYIGFCFHCLKICCPIGQTIVFCFHKYLVIIQAYVLPFVVLSNQIGFGADCNFR